MWEMYEFAYKVGILVTVVAAIVCPIVAHHKGRSALAWFFLGLLLDGIAIIIICCLSDISNKNYTPESSTNSIEEYYAREKAKQKGQLYKPKEDLIKTWKCPICGKENSMSEDYCDSCLASRPR